LFECLARAIWFRDRATAGHLARTSCACALIAGELGFDEHQRRELLIASSMHDVGKLGVPDEVLFKPGDLNEEERALIDRHAEIGHQILSGPRDPVTRLAASIALTHHERVDGRGYPHGLRDGVIPLCGRIAAVADMFDALTHDCPYRPAMPVPDAVDMVQGGRGTQFDASVVDAFERVLPQVLEIDSADPGTDPVRRWTRRAGRAPLSREAPVAR
jgi:putative two-component system response regulator